jgi:hypothetical protein
MTNRVSQADKAAPKEGSMSSELSTIPEFARRLDPDVLADLAQVFSADLTRAQASLAQAARAQDWETARREVHNLSAIFAQLGDTPTAEELERCVRSRDTAALKKLSRDLEARAAPLLWQLQNA